MTRQEVKILIQQFKQKILDNQKDNEVFESLKKTNDKINKSKNKKDESNTTK